MKSYIEAFLMPPLGPFVLLAVGLFLWRRRPRVSRWLCGVSIGSLVVFSQPFVAAALLIGLQTDEPIPADGPVPEADAIVVLGAGIDRGTPELGGPSVGPLSLQRVRYGANLHRRTGLPVLVTGGPGGIGPDSVGQLMADALEEFGAEARWIEDKAKDTRENAERSAKLIDGKRILLVSHAWHLPRAKGAFEAAGFEVICAPTAPCEWPSATSPKAYLPSTRALHESRWGLHEWVGRVWYAITE